MYDWTQFWETASRIFLQLTLFAALDQSVRNKPIAVNCNRTAIDQFKSDDSIVTPIRYSCLKKI